MTIEETKANILIGVHQNSVALLTGELAAALVKNQEQAEELTKLKAELAELKKPIAGAVPEPARD